MLWGSHSPYTSTDRSYWVQMGQRQAEIWKKTVNTINNFGLRFQAEKTAFFFLKIQGRRKLVLAQMTFAPSEVAEGDGGSAVTWQIPKERALLSLKSKGARTPSENQHLGLFLLKYGGFPT